VDSPSPAQIVDIIVFVVKPDTNLHFLFALVSSRLSISTRVGGSDFFLCLLPSLRAGYTRTLRFILFLPIEKTELNPLSPYA